MDAIKKDAINRTFDVLLKHTADYKLDPPSSDADKRHDEKLRWLNKVDSVFDHYRRMEPEYDIGGWIENLRVVLLRFGQANIYERRLLRFIWLVKMEDWAGIEERLKQLDEIIGDRER